MVTGDRRPGDLILAEVGLSALGRPISEGSWGCRDSIHDLRGLSAPSAAACRNSSRQLQASPVNAGRRVRTARGDIPSSRRHAPVTTATLPSNLTKTGTPLCHVIMSTHGKVAHLEDQSTGRPMCGREIETGRRLGLLSACSRPRTSRTSAKSAPRRSASRVADRSCQRITEFR